MAGYGNPGNPGGDTDMYSDAPEGAASAEPKEEQKPDEGGETTLVPKTMLAGKHFDIGEEVVFKIVGMHDDQVEIAYATGEGEGEKGEGEQAAAPEPQPTGAGGGMQSMYE